MTTLKLKNPLFLKKTEENLVYTVEQIKLTENPILEALPTFNVDFINIIHSKILKLN